MTQTPTTPVAGMRLAPCPFCGDDDPEITGENGWVWVACTTGSDCAGRGPDSEDEASAITAWNTRAAAPVADLCRATDINKLSIVLDTMVEAGLPKEQASCFRDAAYATLQLLRTENNRIYANALTSKEAKDAG